MQTMGRPRAITEDEILAAARAVFLHSGSGATTAEVAARCGVGEATIFRRFPTKQALFEAALEFEGQPPWAQRVLDSVGTADLHAALSELGKLFVEWARKVLPARLMQLTNPLLTASARRPIQQVVDKALLELFEGAHRTGQLRVDPSVAVHVYLGTLCDHVLRELLQTGGALSDDALIEGVAALLCTPGRRQKARPRKKGVRS